MRTPTERRSTPKIASLFMPSPSTSACAARSSWMPALRPTRLPYPSIASPAGGSSFTRAAPAKRGLMLPRFFEIRRCELGGSGSHFTGCGEDVVEVAVVAEQAFVRQRDHCVLEQAFGHRTIDRCAVRICAGQFTRFAIGGGLARE